MDRQSAINETAQTENIYIIDVGFSIIGLAAVIGNLTLIHLFRKNKNLRTMTHYFVIALAFADFLFGAIFIPIRLMTVHGIFGDSEYACVAGIVLSKLPLMVSALLLIAIAVERYIQFVHPMRHAQIVTRKRVLIVIALLWIYATFLSMLPVIGWNNIQIRADAGLEWHMSSCSNAYVYRGSFLAVIFYVHVIPMMITMVILYWKIFKAAEEHLKRMVDFELTYDEREKHKKLAKEKRGLIILLIVVVYFVVSWAPVGVMFMVDYKGFSVEMVTKSVVSYSAYVVGFFLAVGNSAINPFIYGLANIRFRRALLNMLGCNEKAKKYNTPTSSRAQSLNALNKV